jgi:hypothetical protein
MCIVTFHHFSALTGPSSGITFQQQGQQNKLPDVKYSVLNSVIITYQLSEQHYTPITQLNFTSGNPFY